MNNNWIEEEMTLAELSDRFLGNNDFKSPNKFDMGDMNIEVLSIDDDGNEVYKLIKSFVVKPPVKSHYTDGKMKVSANHRIIENSIDILASEHDDFRLVDENMDVVDIEVEDTHRYLSAGRIHHNTTPGGLGVPFHSSVRIRLTKSTKIKENDEVVGIHTRAEIVKNRLGPPHRKIKFNILFDSGLDDYEAWFDMAKKYDIVQSPSKGWFEVIDKKTGEVITDKKFRQSEWKKLLLETDGLKDTVYNQIADAVILEYRSPERIQNRNLEFDAIDDDEEPETASVEE